MIAGWFFTRIRAAGPFLSLTTIREAWYWYLLFFGGWSLVSVWAKEVYPSATCGICDGEGRVEESVTEELK